MAQLTNKVKDHFLNPRNVGKLESATCVGEAKDVRRNSNIKLFIKLAGDGRIERATYQIFNNAPAIAPASAFTELVTGKTMSEAASVTREAVMSYLECDPATGGNIRFDILDAFANAVAVLHGEANTPDEALAPKAETHEPAPKTESALATKPKLMVMQLVQDVLDSEIRPAVAMDGGDVELVDIDGKKVLLRLHGHCVGCSSSMTTMRFFVEDRLRELVDPGLEVVDVTQFEGELHAPPGAAGIHNG
ncbi:MAG: NifU family protein [Planctomycetes bacterium]|nr:NifU family protein [Planctomycetota bacterium]NUQ34882.1 NifU family protein [Planctomycetaceae bacterium]